MKVRVKLAFRSFAVGDVIPELPDPTAEDWIRRNLVERYPPLEQVVAAPVAAKPHKGGRKR